MKNLHWQGWTLHLANRNIWDSNAASLMYTVSNLVLKPQQINHKGSCKIEGEHVHRAPYEIHESISKIPCPWITFAQVSYCSAAPRSQTMIDCCAGNSLGSSCWSCLEGDERGIVRNGFGYLSFWTDRLFLHQTDSDWTAQGHDSQPSSVFEELNTLQSVGI